MTADAPLPPSATGALIAGRYRVVAPLGRGGFGVVLRACDLATGGDVALKLVLSEALRHPSALARFHREADLARRLAHPNTVRLLDFGVAEGGRPFIAWELLRGRPLDAVIAAGPLAPARVARIAAQILGSLTEAHALGIVHRDIKPANIFLCDDARGADVVKVLDFGIAKIVGPTSVGGGSAEADAQPLTREGEIPGTPAYMAIEQLMGGELSPSVDLYAVGLLMAEALSGRRVYDGAGMETLRALLGPDPAPLPAEVQSSPLGPVIDRATRKLASERWPSAEAMLDALVRVALPAPSSRDPGASPLAISGPAGASSRPVSNTAAHADTSVASSGPGAGIGFASTHVSVREAEAADTALSPGLRRDRDASPASLAGPPTFASPVAYATSAPTTIGASPYAPAPPARRRGRLVAAIVVGAVALAGGGIAVGLAWNASLDADPGAGPGASPPKRPGARGPSPGLARLDAPGVLAKLVTDEGWKIISTNVTPTTAGSSSVNVMAEKNDKTAMVLFQRFADEVSAMVWAGSAGAAGDMQCKRAGTCTVCVNVDGDRKAAAQLLAAVAR